MLMFSKAPAARKEALRTEQKAWLRCRDLDCGFAAEAYAGGSMQPMVRASCLAVVTEVRTTKLDSLLEDASR